MPLGVLASHGDDRLDRCTRPVVGEADGDLDDRVDRRSGPQRLSDGGGEHAGGLAPVARLVGAGNVDRLGICTVGIGGIDDPDGRHVHRRPAVDDVADAGLARIDMAVVEAGDQPLLGEEDAVQEQRLGLQLRDPPALADQQWDEVLGDGVGVEMVSDRGVDVDQGERHQRVVGDVAIALVIGGDRSGVTPVIIEGRDDPGDVAPVARPDVGGGVALGGAPEGVADSGAGEGAEGTVEQCVHAFARPAGDFHLGLGGAQISRGRRPSPGGKLSAAGDLFPARGELGL